MASLEFHEIASLLNHSRTTYVDLEPASEKTGAWTLYKGHHKFLTSKYPFSVVYLHSRATKEDLEEAGRMIKSDSDQVVYPPSLSKRFANWASLSKRVFKATDKVWTPKEFLRSFIHDELETYIRRLRAQRPEYYVDPRLHEAEGWPMKTPNPILSLLTEEEEDLTHRWGEGAICVLLAEPGQGKTYMSRHIVSELSTTYARKQLVPIMVDSSQWQSMALEEQKSLWKTITQSFRHFGATIGWLEDHEDEFLRATLKADLFRIVFDGFDEYILRNQGNVQPMDVLETLSELAQETGARIVITSRTSFWNASIPTAEVADLIKRTGSLVYRMIPFDLSQAQHYFGERLSDDRHRDRATQIYRDLLQENDALMGRGFVLNLVADVASGGTVSLPEAGGDRGVFWLMRALCRREQRRQELPLNDEQQIRLFTQYASAVATGEDPNTLLLEVSLLDVDPSMPPDTRRLCMEKLKSHPLLFRNPEIDRWRFAEQQVEVTLLADHLLTLEPPLLQQFLLKMRLDEGFQADLVTMLVDMVKEETEEDEQEHLARLIAQMTSLSGITASNEGRQMAAALALLGVERFLSSGSAHLDRTKLLKKLTGGGPISDLDFKGTIGRFDLRGVTFTRCRFDQVVWANCKLDKATTFENCEFFGGTATYCDGMGSVQTPGSKLDQEARAWLNHLRVKEGVKRYSVEDLQDDIHCVVTKFVAKDGVGLKAVKDRDVSRGTVTDSPHRGEVISTLRSLVFTDEEGPSKGRHDKKLIVREEAAEAVRFYASNNNFTGPLREAYTRLVGKLSL